MSLSVGVWWHVGNTKLLKHKNIKAFEFVHMQIIIYENHSSVFGISGDRLLFQVAVLVDTTNFWSYEDTSCAEFCSTELFCYHRNLWCFLVESSYVYSIIMVVKWKISILSLITREIGVRWFPV